MTQGFELRPKAEVRNPETRPTAADPFQEVATGRRRNRKRYGGLLKPPCTREPKHASRSEPSTRGSGRSRDRSNNGQGGIRTLGTGNTPYNGLANRPLRPLGHLSNGVGHYTRIERSEEQPRSDAEPSSRRAPRIVAAGVFPGLRFRPRYPLGRCRFTLPSSSGQRARLRVGSRALSPVPSSCAWRRRSS